MEYNYEIDYERSIIFVVVKGLLTSAEAATMGLAIRLMAKDLNAGIIFDFRQAKNCISVFHAYLWFSNNYDRIDLRYRTIPTVHIPNKNDIEFFRFVQVAWTNSGVCMRMYTDVDEAINWIMQLKSGSCDDLGALPGDITWDTTEAVV